jgi:phosphoheptose isomerase
MRRLKISGPGTNLSGPSHLEARSDEGQVFIRIDADGTSARIYLTAGQCQSLGAFLVSLVGETTQKEGQADGH